MDGQIDSYRLIEPLGEGAAGTVWRAVHVRTGVKVALRVCTSEQIPVLQQRLKTYDHLMGAHSPGRVHVAPVLQRHLDASPPYLVLKYYGGGNLRRLIEATNGEGIPYWRAHQIAADIHRGLQHAHLQGISHGRLTPENVLIDEWGRAVITDFGAVPAPDFQTDLQAVQALWSGLIAGEFGPVPETGPLEHPRPRGLSKLVANFLTRGICSTIVPHQRMIRRLKAARK